MRESITEWRRRARLSQEYSSDRRNNRETDSPAVLGFFIVLAIIAIGVIILYFITGWLYAA